MPIKGINRTIQKELSFPFEVRPQEPPQPLANILLETNIYARFSQDERSRAQPKEGNE